MKNYYLIHSGIQHIQQSALAFNECQLLEMFFTSFAIKENWYKYIPNIHHKKISKILSLRKMDGIPPNKIHNSPDYELIEIIIRTLIGKNNFSLNILPHWRDRNFAKKIISEIDPNCKGVFGFPNNLLEPFKHVSSSSIKMIEQPIGHISSGTKIFKEEQVLCPEFSDSITFNDTSATYLERINEELDLADFVFAPSKFVKETLIENDVNREKIIMNPYGSFLTPIDKPNYNDDKILTVLFVGQLTQRKGIKYLLDSIKIIKDDGVKIKLVLVGEIIGSGLWMKSYSNYIDKHYSSVPRGKMKEMYSNADIFILPSLFEGSALVVYEALAHGLACIVTENTGADKIIDNENGFIVPIRNSEKIAEILFLLNDDRDKLNQIKSNSLQSSTQLSWRNYRNRLQEFLASDNCKV